MTEALPESGAVEAIAQLARDGSESENLVPGAIYAFRLGDRVQVVDLSGDEHADTPARKRGTVRVRDVASFAAYWHKHAVDGVSEAFADRIGRTVTGVLDAHAADVAGWQQHRVVLGLEYSKAFAAWLQADGKLMGQEQFAEFLDDQRADIREPSAAVMLEVAQTIQGTSKVDWEAGHRLVDGQRRIGYIETNTARAGQKGEIAIPTEIVIGVPIFDGAEVAHAVSARFRHRIEGGQLRLMFKLDRPADVVASAFDHATGAVAEECGTTVLAGSPA